MPVPSSLLQSWSQVWAAIQHSITWYVTVCQVWHKSVNVIVNVGVIDTLCSESLHNKRCLACIAFIWLLWYNLSKAKFLCWCTWSMQLMHGYTFNGRRGPPLPQPTPCCLHTAPQDKVNEPSVHVVSWGFLEIVKPVSVKMPRQKWPHVWQPYSENHQKRVCFPESPLPRKLCIIHWVPLVCKADVCCWIMSAFIKQEGQVVLESAKVLEELSRGST